MPVSPATLLAFAIADFILVIPPQFIRHDAPFVPQAVTLVLCFVILDTSNALAAGTTSRFFGRRNVMCRATRTGGSLMAGAGIAAAPVERA